MTGSLPITNTVFISGTYGEGDVENVIDIEAWEISLGAHFPLTETSDIVASLIHSETELSVGSQNTTTYGESLELGIRSELDQKLELFASYWMDLDDNDDSIEIGGLVNLTPALALGISYGDGDGYDVTTIGLRVYFD